MNNITAIVLSKDIVTSKRSRALIGVTFFIIATALGAYVRIPVRGSPVPITLQTFFVLLSGAVLGRRLGALSQTGYLFLGATGLALFQGYSYGVAHLLGPTGGYLIGFIFASFFIGGVFESGRMSSLRILASFTAASIIIYAFGILWLIFLHRVGFAQAVCMGILPFVPGDAAKILLAAAVYRGISSRSKAVFSL